VKIITVNATRRQLRLIERLVPEYYPSRSELVRAAVRDGLRRLAAGERLVELMHEDHKMTVITLNLSCPAVQQLEDAVLVYGYESRSHLVRAALDDWLEREYEDWERRGRDLREAAEAAATAEVPTDMRSIRYQRWLDAEEVGEEWRA